MVLTFFVLDVGSPWLTAGWVTIFLGLFGSGKYNGPFFPQAVNIKQQKGKSHNVFFIFYWTGLI